MTRIEEFGEMIKAIESAGAWDAYPEYWEKLCGWYEIDMHDTETYYEPEVLFRAVLDAYKAEGGTL